MNATTKCQVHCVTLQYHGVIVRSVSFAAFVWWRHTTRGFPLREEAI